MKNTNEIKIKSLDQILAELTPASPEWEKLAAYNHLLQLRNIRDMRERDNAIYSRDYPRDLAEIARRGREQDRLLAEIAATEAVLIKCGALAGEASPAADIAEAVVGAPAQRVIAIREMAVPSPIFGVGLAM